MSRNGLLEGIQEVGRDPALLLIEIGWRWGFGLIVVIITAFSAFLVLDSLSVNPRSVQAMAALNPLQLAQDIAVGISSIHRLIWRAAFSAGLALTAIWVLFSALGRYATLGRAALRPGASLQLCFVVSLLRAIVTVASMAGWFLAGLVAAGLASAGGKDKPSVGLMSAILLLAFLIIVSAWSTLNWFLSLVPLTGDSTWRESVLKTLTLLRSRRDELLEISITNGILRFGLFVVAVLLSLTVSNVITNARILIADLLAISLLYFVCADFLYMAKLIAIRKLPNTSVTRPLSDVLSRPDTTMIIAG